MYFNSLQFFLKVSEPFECRRGDPYKTDFYNFVHFTDDELFTTFTKTDCFENINYLMKKSLILKWITTIKIGNG